AILADRLAVRIGQRPVVLDDTFERLPGEIEPVECRIAPLGRGDRAQRLCIVIEAAEVSEAGIERPLSRMPERRMPEVVREGKRLGEILVETERAGERTGDLGDLQGVGEPGAIMIPLMDHEHLRLVLQPAERGRMDDAVGIAPEGGARGARRLRVAPAAAFPRIARIGTRAHQNIPRLTRPRRIHNYPGRTGRLMTSVTISESAARRIGEILKSEPEGAMLRVSVEGGGCSGFQYKFDIERA